MSSNIIIILSIHIFLTIRQRKLISLSYLGSIEAILAVVMILWFFLKPIQNLVRDDLKWYKDLCYIIINKCEVNWMNFFLYCYLSF